MKIFQILREKKCPTGHRKCEKWDTFVLVLFSRKALQRTFGADLLASGPRVSGDFLGRGMTGGRPPHMLLGGIAISDHPFETKKAIASLKIART